MPDRCLARVAGNVHAPAEARRFAAAFVDALARGGRSADGTGDVATIVSELVTNAVRAGAHSVLIQLSEQGHQLRIEVTDDIDEWPRKRDPGPEDPGGRGLPLVEAMASGWGVEHVPGSGKQVWATVELAG